jgi:RecB family exonuclease
MPAPEKSPASVAESGAAVGVGEIRTAAEEALERIERPLGVGSPTQKAEVIALSYSRLALLRECRMKYALRYIYNLPLSAHEESLEERHPHAGAYALGDLLHRTLMQFHRRERTGAPADALEIFEAISAGHSSKTVAAGRKMLRGYLESPLSHMQTLCEEKEFHWRIESDSMRIMFEGKVDRAHREGNALKIVDYKTGARHDEEHRLQLGIYRLAMEAVFGERDILTSNYYLSTGEEVERRFTVDELSETLDAIIEDAMKIAGGTCGVSGDDRTDISRCAGCGYEALCRDHRFSRSSGL